MEADESAEVVERLLRQHLARRGLSRESESASWSLQSREPSAGGRGLVAARAIARDELVYADRALLLGPRCHSRQPPVCAVCLQAGRALLGCGRGCGLPVCSDACQGSAAHRAQECAYLAALRPLCAADCPERRPGWSLDILRALVPLRALFLRPPDRLLLSAVQAHAAAQHGLEVAFQLYLAPLLRLHSSQPT